MIISKIGERCTVRE